MLSSEEMEMLKAMFDTGKKPRGEDFAFLIEWLSEAGSITAVQPTPPSEDMKTLWIDTSENK